MRRLIMVMVLAVLSWAAFAGPAGAVANGAYDANNHPYVGYANNGVSSCTGALLSPS